MLMDKDQTKFKNFSYELTEYKGEGIENGDML